MRKTLLAVAVFAVLPAYAVADDVFTTIIGALAGSPGPAAPKLPTGRQFETSKVIDVKGEAKGIKLQTLAVGPDGMVYALLGSDRYGQKVPKGEIQVYDATGQKVRGWKVDFQGQAINCASDGTVYVAGDGKLAVFDGAGASQSRSQRPPLHSESLERRRRAQEKRGRTTGQRNPVV